MEDYQEVYDRRCDDHGIRCCDVCLAREGLVNFKFDKDYIPPAGNSVDFNFNNKEE